MDGLDDLLDFAIRQFRKAWQGEHLPASLLGHGQRGLLAQLLADGILNIVGQGIVNIIAHAGGRKFSAEDFAFWQPNHVKMGDM
jgi:hypothetical protein